MSHKAEGDLLFNVLRVYSRLIMVWLKNTTQMFFGKLAYILYVFQFYVRKPLIV